MHISFDGGDEEDEERRGIAKLGKSIILLPNRTRGGVKLQERGELRKDSLNEDDSSSEGVDYDIFGSH